MCKGRKKHFHLHSRPQLSEGTWGRKHQGQNANCQPATEPHFVTPTHTPNTILRPDEATCTISYIHIWYGPPDGNPRSLRRRSARLLLKLMIRPPVFVLHASVSPLRGGSPWRETIPGNWASAVQRLAFSPSITQENLFGSWAWPFGATGHATIVGYTSFDVGRWRLEI